MNNDYNFAIIIHFKNLLYEKIIVERNMHEVGNLSPEE